MNKLTIILTTALLLAGATAMAQRQQIGSSNTFWELSVGDYNDTTLIISGTGDMPDFSGTGEIPWYSVKDGLDYLQIGDSITRIGDNAFYSCKGLTSVRIPNSVTSIGKYAFQYCSGLTSVTIGNSVTSIEDGAFSATVLAAVTIPNSVTTLGEGVFLLTPLTSVSIPSSITSIPNSAFGLCTYLTSVQIPNSVTSIGDDAFALCSGLTTITIPASVASIGERAFGNCSGLTEVINLRPMPVTIDANVFNGVTITACSLKVPTASVSQYQAAAVWGDFNIGGGDYLLTVSVNNPAGGTATKGSLYPANAIRTLTAAPNAGYTFRHWTSNGVEISTANSISITLTSDTAIMAHFAQPIGTSNTWWELIVNGGETTLKITGTGAMPDFPDPSDAPWHSIRSTLRYLEIGDNITHVGDYAFFGCSGLISATLPNSVTSIGNAAFIYCNDLTSADIGNSVTSIGNHAFYDCSNLTSLTIPNTVTSIGSYAFYCCRALTSIHIPASVTIIENSTFQGCNNLTSITIPNSVTSIGNSAFLACTTLTSVLIPNSVTNIGYQAFSNCIGLTSVTIGNSVASIGEAAFGECIGLTSVTIPASATSIKNRPFYLCRSLTSIIVEAANPNYSSSEGILYNKDKTTLIQYPIAKTDTSFSLPNSVTNIENYAFVACTNLISVRIPNTVTSIGSTAFDACRGLTSITIPASVTSIGSGAFYGCTALTEVINLNPEPLSINTYVFYNVNIAACTLKVPTVSVSKYEAAAVWKNFIIEGGGYIVSASVNNAAYGSVSGEGLCQANGTHTLTATANTGYVFTHWTLSGVTLSTDNTYSFTVTQDIELKAHFKPTLSNLTVSEGTLTPAFHQDILNYSVEVDNSITSITLTAQVIDPDALVIGDGTHPLNTGDNTFTIVVLAADKVTTTTYSVKVSRATVGIDELTIDNGQLTIYPNPTTGQLTIDNASLRGTKQSGTIIEQITIYDISGKELQTLKVLDISHLSNGIYFIKIKTENGEVVKKIIKK